MNATVNISSQNNNDKFSVRVLDREKPLMLPLDFFVD